MRFQKNIVGKKVLDEKPQKGCSFVHQCEDDRYGLVIGWYCLLHLLFCNYVCHHVGKTKVGLVTT